ncbi:MAG: contractile injection system tape measure protein [Bacteroidota bacterium]
MNKKGIHIIHKISTSLNCSSYHLPAVDDLNVGDLIKSALDELAEEFDSLGRNQALSFQELSIDLEILDSELCHLKQRIKSVLLEKIEEFDAEKNVQDQIARTKRAKILTPLEVLLFFLKKGRLPWNAHSVRLDLDQFKHLYAKSEFVPAFLGVLKDHPQAVARLVHQFSVEEVIQPIERIVAKEFAIEVRMLIEALRSVAHSHSKIFDVGYRLILVFLEIVWNEIITWKRSGISIELLWINILKKFSVQIHKKYSDLPVTFLREVLQQTKCKRINSLFEAISNELKDIVELPHLDLIKDVFPDESLEYTDDNKKDDSVENKLLERDKEKGDLINAKTTGISEQSESEGFEKEIEERDSFEEKRDQVRGKLNARAFSDQSNFEDQSVRVENAGIVLVHPFLTTFFEKVGLIEKGKFISLECQQRAVCLLHFIATGQLEFEEHALHFQKYICNYPLNGIIPKYLPISPFEKDEVESLLHAVLGYVTALKGTSPQGLRGNYLVRNGVLEVEGAEPILHVEQMTADILLKQVPWTLSYAQWPWNPHLLTIKWL